MSSTQARYQLCLQAKEGEVNHCNLVFSGPRCKYGMAATLKTVRSSMRPYCVALVSTLCALVHVSEAILNIYSPTAALAKRFYGMRTMPAESIQVYSLW